MPHSKLRGYDIEYINNEWVYSDTKKSTISTFESRPCGHCGKYNTLEGHDACLGKLKGVMNACCGHGEESEAYVQFWDGECIHGKDAIVIMKVLIKQIRRDEL